MPTLRNKVALVTGAARGIGAETSRALARKGVKLVLIDLDAEPLKALAAELGDDVALAAAADVCDLAAVQKAVDAGVAKLRRHRPRARERRHRQLRLGPARRPGHVQAGHRHQHPRRLPHRPRCAAVRDRAQGLHPGRLVARRVRARARAGGVQREQGRRRALRQRPASRGRAPRRRRRARPTCRGSTHRSSRTRRSDLTAFNELLASLPGPLGKTTSVDACVDAFVKGLGQAASAGSTCPGWVGAIAWPQAWSTSPIGDRDPAAARPPHPSADGRGGTPTRPVHQRPQRRSRRRRRRPETTPPREGVSPDCAETASTLDHVLIVGAGLSGIGAAVPPAGQAFPERSYAILEARDAIGGTWDLFRYPGIRSDSDMYTLGYRFKPWTGEKAIADGAVDPAATSGRPPRENGDRPAHPLPPPGAARRLVERRRRAGRSRPSAPTPARRVELTAGFLMSLQRLLPLRRGLHARLRRASSASRAASSTRSTGPRTSTTRASGSSSSAAAPPRSRWSRRWPTDAAHVTMLQRSPTYIISLPAKDPLANGCDARCPPSSPTRLTRGRRTSRSPSAIYQLCQRVPGLHEGAASGRLPGAAGCRRATTSTPTSRRRYNPWDQRLCLVPDGDLFQRDPATTSVVDRHRPHRHASPRPGIRWSPASELAGRRRRHRDRPEPAGVRRHRAAPSTATTVDARRDHGLQGHDAQRRAELRVRRRLHQRVVDAEGRPGLRVRRAGCSRTWTRNGYAASRPAPRPGGRARSRSSTSPPATCCAPSTASRSRVAGAVAAAA